MLCCFQLKPVNVDSGHDSSSPPSSPPASKILRGSLSSSASSSLPSSSAYNSISSSTATAIPANRRPKSQYLADLPPKHPNSGANKRHSYHSPQQEQQQKQQQQQQEQLQPPHQDTVTYADLDPKAFMVPRNRVLPPLMSDRAAYAEISVSRSQLV